MWGLEEGARHKVQGTRKTEASRLEAFEKYYHDDVSMQENELPATATKEANRKRELEFLSNILEFRKAEVKGIAVHGNVSYVIWTYDYTHKEWGERNYTQVSVQEWRMARLFTV
jgi:hypothetical protein